MPYQVHWESPDTLLYLKLTGELSFQEFIDIDHEITGYLSRDYRANKVVLLVDVKDAKSVPQTFKELKASQSYAYDYNFNLSHILIVSGGNKLMRLMMMLTYNMCRPSLQFFETPAQAWAYFSHV